MKQLRTFFYVLKKIKCPCRISQQLKNKSRLRHLHLGFNECFNHDFIISIPITNRPYIPPIEMKDTTRFHNFICTIWKQTNYVLPDQGSKNLKRNISQGSLFKSILRDFSSLFLGNWHYTYTVSQSFLHLEDKVKVWDKK